MCSYSLFQERVWDPQGPDACCGGVSQRLEEGQAQEDARGNHWSQRHHGWLRQGCFIAQSFQLLTSRAKKGVGAAVKDPGARDNHFGNSQNLALALEDVCAEALPIEDAMIMAGEQQVKDLRSQHDPNRAGWTELQGSIEQRNPRIERLAREAKEAKVDGC
jgi:hypothetical protein